MKKLKHNHKHIHKLIKKHAPHAYHKARRMVSFHPAKFFFLLLIILISYYFFRRPEIIGLMREMNNFSYAGNFLAGLFFAFGLSAPLAIGFLVTSNPSNFFLAAAVGGLGATIGDIFIFKFIKFSFMNEFKRLEKTGVVRKIEKLVSRSTRLKHYLIYVFAGLVIATPLPDELGVSMLAGLTTIKLSRLIAISFVLHTLAIFSILYLGSVL